MKKNRDTERPPAAAIPRIETAAVSVARTQTVHLAQRAAPPKFTATTTLCGKKVEAIVAIPSAAVTCLQCEQLSRASA